MSEVVGIRLRDKGRAYYFDPCGESFKRGDHAVVETVRGMECGEVNLGNTVVDDSKIKEPLRKIIRKATEDDLLRVEENKRREQEAFKVCERKISEHRLPMKLIEVEYAFDGSKILFYFSSNGRVDFRSLVKDLAGYFRTRIELRQIGVRDEARMLGGLGICGRPFCCQSFLGGFQPVSIKMAKEQGLSLNPVKISGSCGRLMCCLKYEQEAYQELLKDAPREGSTVMTADGKGIVINLNLIAKRVTVELDKEPEGAPKIYKMEEVKVLRSAPVQYDRYENWEGDDFGNFED